MKHKSLVNKLVKSGFKVENVSYRDDFFFAKGKKNMVEWFHTEFNDCTTPYIKKIGDKDDLMTDYHCGFFAGSIKEVIKYLEMVD